MNDELGFMRDSREGRMPAPATVTVECEYDICKRSGVNNFLPLGRGSWGVPGCGAEPREENLLILCTVYRPKIIYNFHIIWMLLYFSKL